MGAEYSQHLYLERAIDQDLWELARKWLGSSRHHWITIQSAPGRGNSWLLKNLEEQTRRYEIGFQDIAVVRVKQEHSDPSFPHDLGPLERELYSRFSQSRIRPLKRLKRRLRKTGPFRISIFLGLLLIGILTGSVLKGLSQYSQMSNYRTMGISKWFSGFINNFVPDHWHEFPVWFLAEWIVMLPVGAGLAVYSYYWARKDDKDEVVEDTKHFQSEAELVQELNEICQGRRGLLLIVDDGQNLSTKEKQFLFDLTSTRPNSSLNHFNRKTPILVVTDLPYDGAHDGAQPFQHTLAVPSFTLTEAQEIANRQLVDDGDRAAKQNLARLFAPQHNINELFAHRPDQLKDEIGDKFLAAESQGLQGIFDVAEMMGYFAASHQGAIASGELVELLESPAFVNDLSVLGYRPIADATRLVKDFADHSSLVRLRKKILHFDLRRCRTLEQWLIDSDRRMLLAQGHFLWFRKHYRKAVGTQPLAPLSKVQDLVADNPGDLRKAAWHATQIGILLDNPLDLLSNETVTASVRAEITTQVATAMLGASALYRHEGDFLEAIDLIPDAVEWIEGCDEAAKSGHLEAAVGQLWACYWLRGDADFRDRLEALASSSPTVRQSSTWAINERFAQVVTGSDKLAPTPADVKSLAPELQNLDLLTEVTWKIRQAHGLTAFGLDDSSIDVSEPLTVSQATTVEAALRQLKGAGAISRGEIAALLPVFENWSRRLTETKPHDGYLGLKAVHVYSTARYWHLLGDVWKAGTSEADETVEKKDDELSPWRNIVEKGSLETLPSDEQLWGQFVWERAKENYEKSLQVAALLDCSALVAEISFHFGLLLKEQTPPALRIDVPPWWRRWDELFENSIALEQHLGWIANTPAMHHARWLFFDTKDHERSLEDAYNAFQSAKLAHYPSRLLLGWHKKVRAHLTNFGDSEKDRQRDAELHEIWARELAHLPEATQHWQYENLRFEQASNLEFAAQARRLINQFDQAWQLLDEADELMAQEGTADESESPQKVRDLTLSLKLQRAWLLSDEHETEKYSAAIHDLWRQVQINDEVGANVLKSLVTLELEQKKLGGTWPVNLETPIHCDPDNPALSLPPEWFAGDAPLRIEQRFDFRFYQLLNFLNGLARAGGNPLASLHLLAESFNRPEFIFSKRALMTAAAFFWYGTNNFGKVALSFVNLGLNHNLLHREDLRPFVITLLESLQYYYSAIEEVDRLELKSLKLLMAYLPGVEHYRARYVKVLTESEYLDWHESLARGAAQPDWFKVASKVNDYLETLVDPTLLAHWRALQLTQAASPDDLAAAAKHRGEVWGAAQGQYVGGDHSSCRQLLESILPHEQAPWLSLDDLRILDLWLRCAEKESAPPLDVAKRRDQLRKSALKFIGQFELVIREQEVQQLAAKILKDISG